MAAGVETGMWKRSAVIVILLGAPLVLAGCGAGGTATPGDTTLVSQGPGTIVKDRTPVQLYAHVARQVRACWFNPRNPVLAKHVFRGEAGAGGKSGTETGITIYEQTRERKLGLKAFTIEFRPVRGGTQVMANNQRLPDALGRKLAADVGYWVQGGQNCAGPATATQAREPASGPAR